MFVPCSVKYRRTKMRSNVQIYVNRSRSMTQCTLSLTTRLDMQRHRVDHLITFILVHHYVLFHKLFDGRSSWIVWMLIYTIQRIYRKRSTYRSYDRRMIYKKLIYPAISWVCRIYPSGANQRQESSSLNHSNEKASETINWRKNNLTAVLLFPCQMNRSLCSLMNVFTAFAGR